jgi:hypothetical protein
MIARSQSCVVERKRAVNNRRKTQRHSGCARLERYDRYLASDVAEAASFPATQRRKHLQEVPAQKPAIHRTMRSEAVLLALNDNG